MLYGRELARVSLPISPFSEAERISSFLALSLHRLISLVKPGAAMGRGGQEGVCLGRHHHKGHQVEVATQRGGLMGVRKDGHCLRLYASTLWVSTLFSSMLTT